MNKVSGQFVRYLKIIRKQAKINTRELAEVAGKSNAYVSILENGKINTIDFITAYKMFDYINKKKPFIKSDYSIYELLTEQFDIYPADYWEKIFQQQELRQQAKIDELERISEKLDLISSLIEDEVLVDLLLNIVQANLDDSDIDILSYCLSMLKKGDEKKKIYDFIEEEGKKTWQEKEK